jgi:hypothetical protein
LNVTIASTVNEIYVAAAGTLMAYLKNGGNGNMALGFYKYNGTVYKSYGSVYSATGTSGYTVEMAATGALCGVFYIVSTTWYIRQYQDTGTTTSLKYSVTNYQFGDYTHDGSFYSYTYSYGGIKYLLVYYANFTLYSNISTGMSSSTNIQLRTMKGTAQYIAIIVQNTSILIYKDSGIVFSLF